MRVYVASSWKNEHLDLVNNVLRGAGHETYDFREDGGFHWSHVIPDWKERDLTIEEVFLGMHHPIARAGFERDKANLDWCEAIVLVLPCGRSAHLELGYCIGQGKRSVIVYTEEPPQPDLMHNLADYLVPGMASLLEVLS